MSCSTSHSGSILFYHYNAICIHSLQNTEEKPIDLETIQTAPAAHRRYPSSPAAATLHGKTLGFVLRLPHQNQPHATFMQPLITINAFCSTTYTSMQPLQCDLHPLVAEHRGGTDWPRNDPNRTRRTQEVPFIAGCSDFTRKNARFRAPASSPKHPKTSPTQQPFIECIVMWCQVSHHPSLSVLLCDVKSHTTLHWVYCYVMSSLTPPFIECIVTWCQV